MAKSSNSKSNSPHFLTCFGFSRKFRPIKPSAAAANKNRPFSWIKLRFKPSPPVHRKLFKPGRDRFGFRSVAPATACKSSNEEFGVVLPAATNQTGEERPEEVKNGIVQEKIIFETGKHSNSPKKLTDPSQPRFSLTRKLESFRSCRFTQPTSPSVKESKNSITISHSLSCPPPNPSPSEPGPITVGHNGSGLNDGDMNKNYGPVAGLSILILTLANMVLWGKLCAIFCTAGWIFIVTGLRSIVEEDGIDFIESDSYSQGFMKKLVILKRFLYRNQREKLLKKL